MQEALGLIPNSINKTNNKHTKNVLLPGVVVETVIPAFQRLTEEDYKFEANLHYTSRPCLKKIILFRLGFEPQHHTQKITLFIFLCWL
jgi:hypothetical protein